MLKLNIDRNSFRQNYFEKNILLFENALNDFGFNMNSIDEFLYCVDARPPFVRLFQNGQVPEAQFIEEVSEIGLTRPRICKTKLYRYLTDGATLVLNRMEVRSVQIKRLCMEVRRFLGEQTVANGYLAFGGDGTFGKHWDTHDVFVIQLIGRKRWQIFEPTFELPISGQTSKSFKDACPVEPCFDRVLEPGDVLYIPRGWWHHAIPIEGEETFHVAVGIHVPTALDYIIWACANVLPRHMAFRRSIDLQTDGSGAIDAAADIIADLLRAPDSVAAFRQRAMAKDTATTGFNLASIFARSEEEWRDHRLLKPKSTYPAAPDRISAILAGLSVPPELSTLLVDKVWTDGGASIGALGRYFSDAGQLQNTVRALLREDHCDLI